jgi:hypothetical protein
MLRLAIASGALGILLWAPVTRAEAAADAPLAPAAAPGVSLPRTERTGFGLHLGVAAVAGVVTVPAGLFLAAGLGSLSNSLIWAAIPAVLSFGLLAPTLTTLAAYLIGNWNDPGRYGFWAPWAASVLVNALALVVGGFAGFSIGMPVQVLLFSLIDGLVVGGVSAGTMRLLEKKPEATAMIRSFVPGVGDTAFVPVSTVGF